MVRRLDAILPRCLCPLYLPKLAGVPTSTASIPKPIPAHEKTSIRDVALRFAQTPKPSFLQMTQRPHRVWHSRKYDLVEISGNRNDWIGFVECRRKHRRTLQRNAAHLLPPLERLQLQKKMEYQAKSAIQT